MCIRDRYQLTTGLNTFCQTFHLYRNFHNDRLSLVNLIEVNVQDSILLSLIHISVKIYNYLVGKGIIVRNRNSVSLCGNCMRVTVGTRGENEKLIEALTEYM